MKKHLLRSIVLFSALTFSVQASADIIVVEGKVSEDDCSNQANNEAETSVDTTAESSSAPVSSANTAEGTDQENTSVPGDDCIGGENEESDAFDQDTSEMNCEDLGQGVELCVPEEMDPEIGCASGANPTSGLIWFLLLGLFTLRGWRNPRTQRS